MPQQCVFGRSGPLGVGMQEDVPLKHLPSVTVSIEVDGVLCRARSDSPKQFNVHEYFVRYS